MSKQRQQQIILLRASAALPKNDIKGYAQSAPIAPPASSPFASVGAQDPRAYTQEAAEWIRQAENPADADAEFWSKKAPSRQSRMWNDLSVPDSAFAYDAKIPNARQRHVKR
jgi:hypothetical protein